MIDGYPGTGKSDLCSMISSCLYTSSLVFFDIKIDLFTPLAQNMIIKILISFIGSTTDNAIVDTSLDAILTFSKIYAAFGYISETDLLKIDQIHHTMSPYVLSTDLYTILNIDFNTIIKRYRQQRHYNDVFQTL